MLDELEGSAGIPQVSTVAANLTAQSNLLRSSSHHVLTTITPWSARMFRADVLRRTGEPDVARTIAEGLGAQARQNSVEGRWQGLNVGMVRMFE